ncbi:MAG: hypothetical protein WCC14_00820, partial [Acidobacteriaceae bacterium]
EAEAAARTVMQRPPAAGAPVSPARAAQPRLSRADGIQSTSSASQTANKEDQESWIPVSKGKHPLLADAGVRAIARLKSDPDLVAVQMGSAFELPRQKGPTAKPLWDAQARAGALEAIMEPGATEPKTKVGLKQERPDTDDLRDLWLLKVGWPDGGARAAWKEAANQAKTPNAARSTFRPSTKAGSKRCDVDHILELQFGGNNVAQNVQMLDRSPNRSSGALISSKLRSQASKIRNALRKNDPTSPKDRTKTTAIRMQFDSVKFSDDTLDHCQCCDIEAHAKDPQVLKAANESQSGKKGEARTGPGYPMRWGAFHPCVFIDDDKNVDLLHSGIPENKAASTLIRGLLLDVWTLPAKKSGMKTCPDHEEAKKETPDADASGSATGKTSKEKAAQKAPSQAGGTVSAKIDPKSRIVDRLKIKGDQELKLFRDADGNLKAPRTGSRLDFVLRGLSEGYFTRLDVDAEGNLTGAGKVIPSARFLPRPIDVEFDKDRFVMTTQVKKPTLPIPGVEITDCSIGLQIAPEFKPEGKVGFRVAPGGKQIMHGLLTVSADENGLVVNGEVYASIPGVDETKGTLTLKNNQWSVGIEIKAGGDGKIRYVKSVDVSIGFAQQRMTASGTAELTVPGVTEPVKAEVSYDEYGWAFSGLAKFHPPRLKEVAIHLRYARGRLSGEGDTEFEFHHQKGKVHVSYDEGMFSGKGSLAISTKRAEGSIDVEMHHRPSGALYFTGEGHVTFRIRDDLEAGAGVKIDDQEKVTVTGELAFTKPITLFRGFSGDYTFFSIQDDIPLPPPLSIAGVGLEVNIGGSLSAHYEVGPVTLEDVKATADFQPLEEDPAIKLDLSSHLVIKAMGSITGEIEGGLKINAYIAYVRGDLGIKATGALKGLMDIPFHAHYEDGKITADVEFKADLTFALVLALVASVEAHAGFKWFSVSTGKEWTLGSYTYAPNLALHAALKKPIHYESPDQFTLPSVDDITWTDPPINGRNAIESTAGASRAGEEHDV